MRSKTMKMSLLCLAMAASTAVIANELVPPSDEGKIVFEDHELASTESDLPLVDSETFTSDGTGKELDRIGLTFFPPKGWEVKVTNGRGAVVSMKEPKREVNAKNPVDYQRNITIGAIHNPSPIDKQRAKELRKELLEVFQSRDSYTVDEMRFFDYQGKKDGLLVYSSSKAKKIDLTHMHLLVSGKDKQFMLTYSDLSDRFTGNPELMDEAWTSMASIQVVGQPPKRWQKQKQWAISSGVGILLLVLFSISRRIIHNRRLKKMVAFEETDIEDEGATMVVADATRVHANRTRVNSQDHNGPQLDIGLQNSFYSNAGLKDLENGPLKDKGSLVSGVWNLSDSDEVSSPGWGSGFGSTH